LFNAYMTKERGKRNMAASAVLAKDVDAQIMGIQQTLMLVLATGDLDEAKKQVVGFWEMATSIDIRYWRQQYVDRFVRLPSVKTACKLCKLFGHTLPADLVTKVGV
jgi:hypothetical protein